MPDLPINPATGLPWTEDDVNALRDAIDAANTSLGGDQSAQIATDTTADAVQDLGGDAAIVDPAERASLGLAPLGTPPPVDVPPPDTTPTLDSVAAHVDDLETRVSQNTTDIAALKAMNPIITSSGFVQSPGTGNTA